MNQCIHGIDLLRWTFGGEIEEVYSQTHASSSMIIWKLRMWEWQW